MKLDPHKLAIAQARACMTSQELCERAELSKTGLSLIRHGSQAPRPQTIGRLAKALDVPVEELIAKEGLASVD